MTAERLIPAVLPTLCKNVLPWAAELPERVRCFRTAWDAPGATVRFRRPNQTGARTGANRLRKKNVVGAKPARIPRTRDTYPHRCWDARNPVDGNPSKMPAPPIEAAWSMEDGLWVWFDVLAPASLALMAGAYEAAWAVGSRERGEADPGEGMAVWYERMAAVDWLVTDASADPRQVGLPWCSYPVPMHVGELLASLGRHVGFDVSSDWNPGGNDLDPLALAFLNSVDDDNPVRPNTAVQPFESRAFVGNLLRRQRQNFGLFQKWPEWAHAAIGHCNGALTELSCPPDRPVTLDKNECAVLKALALKPGRKFTLAELSEELECVDAVQTSRSLSPVITKLISLG